MNTHKILLLIIPILICSACSEKKDFSDINNATIEKLEISSWNIMRDDYNYKGVLDFEKNTFKLSKTFVPGEKEFFKFPSIEESKMDRLKNILSQNTNNKGAIVTPKISITVHTDQGKFKAEGLNKTTQNELRLWLNNLKDTFDDLAIMEF